jgi:hypothetical protein
LRIYSPTPGGARRSHAAAWAGNCEGNPARPRLTGRIPPALPGAAVILVMIAMLIWLF